MGAGEIVFVIFWCALAVWTFFSPNGYGPYIMLGFIIGDFMATLYCAIERGYLKEEGDLDLWKYLLSTLGFAYLGGFYIGGLSFQPGSDAYNNAVYVVFVVFLMVFLYRFLQYTLANFTKK